MIDKNIILKVRKFAIDNSEPDDIHGFNHVERVYDMSIKIGEKLNANIDLLKISVLLHDIGRIDEKKDKLKRNHAEISAEKALKYLTSHDFNIPRDDVDKIIHCIKAHSFSNKMKPQTLEAKILSDVDKLDALGAIGLYRAIKMGRNIEQVIEHFENKIIRLKDYLYLDVSKELAKERQKIIIDFYNEIKDEI